ncbi:hypothetical protein TruAng_002153 [Truncatella angustata]|nr:hypothetical protein TruAng_002153 [Truncatella angustata]
MATEATSEKPVDVSVTDASLQSQTTASTEPQPQHVQDPSPPTVNGTGSHDEPEKNKAVNDIVDEVVNSAEVSVSGGSDTEASTSKPKDGNHASSSSTLKKPQSFKSVSVNRSFLGPKNAANATSRSETSSPSLTPAAPAVASSSSASKLKLVAKSGSSLGGATKTITTNGKGSGVPDGGTVWNKNKPTPTPETKKFSDEELKKYGIHMADRLRPESQSGQANWADDDDDEWQPEQITWTDGTRITLDNQPTPNPAPAVPVVTASTAPLPIPTTTNVPVPVPTDKPKSPAPALTSGSARASPSVKPSLITSSSGKSLVLKGVPEKPTLVAKAPALPTPVKSPWASLPPVEKASPVLMDVSDHQHPPAPMRGYPPRDPSLGQSATPPPAKEIAADDFTRSPWRDGPTGGNRELYNSQSGRYEPVHDRRGSRHDINHRHPALLQRPMQQHDHQGPAEPSAAFQTSRNSGQDGMPYGRRRNSSNVSGGSGSFAHRLGKLHDMPPPEHSLPAPTQASPARSQHAQPWQPRPSPGQTHAVPQAVPQNVTPVTEAQPDPAAAAIPSEDDVELQKRLMRERRELAIKRRLEEEANEEAARKERIRLKLEAMGPAPERKSTKKDEPKEAPYKRDGPPAGIFTKDDLAAAAAERAIQPSVTSPKKQEISPAMAETNVNGTPPPPTQADKSQLQVGRGGPPPGNQTAQSWPESARKSTERLPSWGTGPQPGPKNVWAAPGNDRSLGNGTFDADLGQLANSEPTQPASVTARPTPIGPPRSTSQGQTQRHEQQPGRLAPIGPPGSGRPGAPPVHGSNVNRRNLWATADIAADDRAIRAEKQKQAEEYRKNLESQGLSTNEVHHGVSETWRGVNVGHDGKRLAGEVLTTHHGERLDRPAAPTWEAPVSGSQHEHARSEAHILRQQLHRQDYRASHGPHDSLYTRAAPMGPASTAPPGPPMVQPRAGSRFFPHHGSRDVRHEEMPAPPRSKSPTPPPPTMDGHPAYDGDVAHPHVSLPPTRPVVKLPPAVTRQTQAPKQATTPVAPKPATFAAAAAAAAAAPISRSTTAALAPGRGANYGGNIQTAGEIKKQENWQEKINSLVRAAPGKPMSVDSSSKYAFDAHANTSATVSLPALSPTGSSSSEFSSITSKEMAEECFDEQEMGSLPLINLPHDVPPALWPNKAAEPNWYPLQTQYRIDALGSESVRFPYEMVNHKSVYRVLTPGMDEPKTVLAPYTPRNRSNPQRQGRGGRGSRGGQRGGRDSFGDHQKTPTISDRPERPDRTTSRGGGRGNFRARSENWSRNSSSLAQPMQS